MKFGTRSALTPAGWESMVALLDPLRLYDLSPESFVSRELMAYAENAGNPMPLSRYLPLQKGEVIFPESITGNMPSDFSKYAKAIKRVFSAGEERAVCRILPVSGGNALFGYLVVWETGRKMQSVEYLALEIAASSLALERFRTDKPSAF